MDIKRLLEAAVGQSDEDILGMLLSNRIDKGSSDGGLISAAKFPELIEDIKAWRTWSTAQNNKP